ncbi:MAG: hypothetical protein H6834_11775 [Planctomycetes bacterium]|nr:hypothetical protein [Planctomycetota bacterium]
MTLTRGDRSDAPVSPTWRDPWILAAIVCLLVWHGIVFETQWGARAADSVEYVDRATLIARELTPGSDTPRSALPSLVLAPIRMGLDAMGSRDVQTFVIVVRLLASSCTVLSVLLAAALARRIAGDLRCARCVAWMLATDLVFAAWGGEPLSVPAATGFLLAGALAATRPGACVRVPLAGLLLGTAVAIKYQVLAIAPFVAWIGRGATPRRDAWARLALTLFASWGLASASDLLAYGDANTTWVHYLKANVLPLGYSALHPILPTTWSIELQQWLFDIPVSDHLRSGAALVRRRPWHAYATEWYEWLSPFGLALIVLAGLAWITTSRRATRRTTARPFALVLLLAANLVLLSLKGAKEPRLLFPWLPWLWILVSLGIARWSARRLGRFAAIVLLVGATSWPALSLKHRIPHALAPNDLERLQRHWSYAEAMRWLARIGPGPGRPPFEIVAAYHFAVSFEETPGVFAMRSPHALDAFQRLAPSERDEVRVLFEPRSVVHMIPPRGPRAAELEHEARAASRTFGGTNPRTIRGYRGDPVIELDARHEHLDALATKVETLGGRITYRGVSRPEWLLTHSQTLTSQPDLLAWIGKDYELAALFYDPERSSADYHPLWALRRRGMEPSAVALFGRSDELPNQELSGFRPIVFQNDDGPCFELVGVSFHPRCARDGYVVPTLHWKALRTMNTSWTFAHRLTIPGMRALQIDALPAFGVAPTTDWRPGEIVSETLVFPLPTAFPADSPRASVSLWLGAHSPSVPPEHHPRPIHRTGFHDSPDGLVRVGGTLAGPRRDRSVPP